MSKIRSDQLPYSRYNKGGNTTVTGGKITWWDRTVFPRSPTDIDLQITTKYQGRPDLLAYDLYGRADLEWFILQYNNIVDVIEEFKTGAILTLPTKSRLFGELLTKT